MPLKTERKKTIKIWPNVGSVFDVISGPAMLAIPLAIIIFLLLKLDFNPVILKLDNVEKVNADERISTYVDIDGDGITERLMLYNYPTNAAVIAYTQDNAILEVWNLEGYWNGVPLYFCYDQDNDKIQEIYSITIKSGDSIFVGKTELNIKGAKGTFCFVDKVLPYNGNRNIFFEILGMTDITGGAQEELIFTVTAGFSFQPRAVYAWNIEENKIIRSPMAGIAYTANRELITFDLNNDHKKEIFLTNRAVDNKEKVDYPDTASYLTVFTRDMHYFLPPILIGEQFSIVTAFPYITKKDTLLAAFNFESGFVKDKCKILLFDRNGRFLYSKKYEYKEGSIKLIFSNQQIVLLNYRQKETSLIKLDENLDPMYSLDIPGSYLYIYSRNLDADSDLEYIFFDSNASSLLIVDHDIKEYATIKLPEDHSNLEDVSLIESYASTSLLHIDTTEGRIFVKYQKNPIRNFIIPIFLACYLLSYLVFFLLQKLFIYRNNQRKEMENKMLELQLQSVMNQLNPHFTFNAINTIGDSVLKGKREEAYEYFTKLSELIRNSMSNAFNLDKKLGEEIEFVTQYLEIESFRFEGKLSYSINVDPAVDMDIAVPKMLMHIFVENAVKHGVFHRETPGKIWIEVSKNHSITTIIISDNGIGRKAAKSIRSNSAGKGLQILDSYLVLFRKSNGSNIIYTIEDLEPGFKYPGTKVIIKIHE